MNVISENLANVDTTKTEDGGPYRRKIVQVSNVMPPDGLVDTYKAPKIPLTETSSGHSPHEPFRYLGNQAPDYGVYVADIVGDPSAFKLVYDPSHPDANAEGYVEMPNVNTVQEMIDLISASRSYEANVTALNSTKEMIRNALKI
ncbi:MAG: flagellar basal body rod protein FlgC [Candidatus Cloacimonetes bacterium]|nr:flagellar basal body rod protein FlgC [Candidatus Cloacimonadota bacterium]